MSTDVDEMSAFEAKLCSQDGVSVLDQKNPKTPMKGTLRLQDPSGPDPVLILKRLSGMGSNEESKIRWKDVAGVFGSTTFDARAAIVLIGATLQSSNRSSNRSIAIVPWRFNIDEANSPPSDQVMAFLRSKSYFANDILTNVVPTFANEILTNVVPTESTGTGATVPVLDEDGLVDVPSGIIANILQVCQKIFIGELAAVAPVVALFAATLSNYEIRQSDFISALDKWSRIEGNLVGGDELKMGLLVLAEDFFFKPGWRRHVASRDFQGNLSRLTDRMTALVASIHLMHVGEAPPAQPLFGDSSRSDDLVGVRGEAPPFIPRAQPLFGDSSKGDDLLGVGEAAQALADTIAFKDLEPPFAAGILGAWGCGKSFFIELIMQHLRGITKHSLVDDEVKAKFPYVGHIYVVHFGVWAFAKGNLWASIMYQILLNLNNQLNLEAKLREGNHLLKGVSSLQLIDELSSDKLDYLKLLLKDGKIEETLQDILLTMPVNRTTATEALVKAMDVQYESDRQQLRRLKAKRARAQLELKKKKALTRVSEDPTSRKFLERIRSRLLFFGALSSTTTGKVDPKQIAEDFEALHWCLRPFVQVFSGDMSALWTALLILITVFAFFIPDILEKIGLLNNVERIISWITAPIPILFGVSKMAKSTENHLEKINKAYMKGFEEDIDMEEGDPLQSHRNQNATNGNGNEALTPSEIADIAKLEERLILVEGDSIDEVVGKRLESSGYESHLGIVHKAQQDLARLSRAFLSEDEKARKIFPRGKPRVVLMIDDLDRCPPDKVVETLEAAQLLVKTELFVVVMAVDVRYVSLALEKKYEGILIPKRRPSGMDYLEKIIQLPYRLPVIDSPEAMRVYLKTQMGELEKLPVDAPKNMEDAVRGTEEPAEAPIQSSTQPREEPLPEPSPEPPSEQPAVVEVNQEVQTILPTIAIKFNEEELELLSKVCLAVGVSPRVGKRLVNVFKLFKIIWHRQDERRTESGIQSESAWSPWTRRKGSAEQHRDAREASILLLAMCSSPHKDLHFAMGDVFASIERSRSMPRSRNLKDLVLEAAASEEAFQSCRNLVNEWEHKVRWSNEEEWANIRQYLRLVRSFSFVVPMPSHDV